MAATSFLPFLVALLATAFGDASDAETTELRMPGVQPDQNDVYLCRGIRLDAEREHYIVGFTPHGSMHTAHHILVYGCSMPGTDEEVWECGEMANEGTKEYRMGPVCADGAQIIYAWAHEAPELNLPEGVGFKVGGDTSIRYLVVQVHYMHPMENPDYSGVTLHSTTDKMSKRAGILLMLTGGKLPRRSQENFETACVIDENVELHPFAFRTHAHKHSKVISGYRIRDKKWTLIGKKDPQLPQMFYPTDTPNLTVKKGDIVAARCTMKNDEDRDIYIGNAGSDEMCNFYMMYYVNGDTILDDGTCFSPGPPEYHWSTEGGLENIPEDASKL